MELCTVNNTIHAMGHGTNFNRIDNGDFRLIRLRFTLEGTHDIVLST